NESGEKSYEHIRPKKALFPKDSSVFDFMLRPPHDDSPVVDSPTLNVSADLVRVKKNITENCKNDAGTFGSEIEYIEKLLKEYKIEGFEVLYSSPTLPNVFPLNRIAESRCPLCNR